VRAAMIEALSKDHAQSWEDRLAARGVPIAKINSIAEAAEIPQLAHRGILTPVPRAEGIDEDLRLVGAPYINNIDGPEALRPPPTLGQHSREVLASVGISDTDADALIAEGVIGVSR
jgi:crotonobetainyl-CoA:carnitine CoA-transferase CaiB-like acyl-CoA transferase